MYLTQKKKYINTKIQKTNIGKNKIKNKKNKKKKSNKQTNKEGVHASLSISKPVLATVTVHNCLQDRRYLQKSLTFVSRRGYKVEETFLYWYSSM